MSFMLGCSRIIPSVSRYRNFVAQIFRLPVQNQVNNGLLICERLADIILEQNVAGIGVEAESAHAEIPGDKNSARQMECLCSTGTGGPDSPHCSSRCCCRRRRESFLLFPPHTI